MSLAKNRDFKEHELNQVTRLIVEHKQTLLEAWYEYFGT
ncbi:MAG: hypothetical protein ACM3SR_08900 [Ignavibacteriales bacterium]